MISVFIPNGYDGIIEHNAPILRMRKVKRDVKFPMNDANAKWMQEIAEGIHPYITTFGTLVGSRPCYVVEIPTYFALFDSLDTLESTLIMYGELALRYDELNGWMELFVHTGEKSTN